MKATLLPKSGIGSLKQEKFPLFGYIYLTIFVCIQFFWGGLKAAKILLLVDELQFSECEAVIIIHLQSSLMDLVMSIGGILANLHCGSFIACVAQELLKALLTCPLCTLATMGFFELEQRRNFYLYGQVVGVITSFGNNCITSLLADQFNIINYYKFNRIQVIFTMTFTALGIFTVPHLIQYYRCFWTETCYSFVWISEWILCILQVSLFIVFSKKLVKRKPKFSATYMMFRLARDASKKKRISKESGEYTEKPLFLYSDLYSPEIRRDAQKMWSLWTFYFPLAVYWALHSQQSTTWILQAKRLDGNLFGWSTILPNELWGVIPLTAVAFRLAILTFIEDPKYPLRMVLFSQVLMGIAFGLSAILEKFIDTKNYNLHMVWALPQLLLVSLSDIVLLVSYRKFIIREVPASFRQVAQNLFVLSRCFGNFIVVVTNLLELLSGFPHRFVQFIIYTTLLNFFIIIFTIINSKFERLLQYERKIQSGPSGVVR